MGKSGEKMRGGEEKKNNMTLVVKNQCRGDDS